MVGVRDVVPLSVPTAVCIRFRLLAAAARCCSLAAAARPTAFAAGRASLQSWIEWLGAPGDSCNDAGVASRPTSRPSSIKSRSDQQSSGSAPSRVTNALATDSSGVEALTSYLWGEINLFRERQEHAPMVYSNVEAVKVRPQ
jgi:hypothetical protein